MLLVLLEDVLAKKVKLIVKSDSERQREAIRESCSSNTTDHWKVLCLSRTGEKTPPLG